MTQSTLKALRDDVLDTIMRLGSQPSGPMSQTTKLASEVEKLFDAASKPKPRKP